MSSVSSISAVNGLSAGQQIAILQEQMFFYSQFAQANPPASTDYKTLQYAVLTQNVSDAQEALARLQVDNLSSADPGINPASTTDSNSVAAILSQETSSAAQSNSSLNVLA